MLTDAEIWTGIRNGDYKAFEQLYNSYFRKLYSYGRKLCHDSEQVEDAIHDLFLDLWKYQSNLSETTSISFYLFRALRRRIHVNLKETQKSTLFDKEVDSRFLFIEHAHDEKVILDENAREAVLKVKKLISSLPERQYEAILLKFFGDLSYKEIAQILEVNEQSARNLVQRGLETLRGTLPIIVFILLLGFPEN